MFVCSAGSPALLLANCSAITIAVQASRLVTITARAPPMLSIVFVDGYSSVAPKGPRARKGARQVTVYVVSFWLRQHAAIVHPARYVAIQESRQTDTRVRVLLLCQSLGPLRLERPG